MRFLISFKKIIYLINARNIEHIKDDSSRLCKLMFIYILNN